MTPLRVFLALGLFVVLSLTAFAAAAAPATLPTWQVGQDVGYGTNLNLTALAVPFLNEIKLNPSDYNLTAVNALDFTGSFDAWTYDQVTQKTATDYVLASQSTQGLTMHLNVNVTAGNLPAPGTYSGTCTYGYFVAPSIPSTTRTVAATLDWTSLSASQAASYYTTAGLALQNGTVNATLQTKASVSVIGFPFTDVNLTRCDETITYRSEDFALLVNTQGQFRTVFQPALDVFNFPINDNETWWANATTTVGATISGTIDVQGLNTSDQEAFFDNLTKVFQSVPGLAVTGLDHFPIDLAKITATVGGVNVLQNGMLQDQSAPVDLQLHAASAEMTLSDNQLHSVYEIYPEYNTSFGVCPPTVAAIFAPDFPAANAGMVVGYEIFACIGSTQLPIFELKNVPPSAAKDHIQQTETNYRPFAPAQSNAFADFFVAAPYWGFLILVFVAIAAVVFVFMRRRGRRMIPPMPSPPPPPGGP